MAILSAAFVSDADRVDSEMYRVPLSADGTLPPTHWGACGVVEREVIAQEGVRWFRWELDSTALVESVPPTDPGPPWSWGQSLVALGLVAILAD